MITLYFVDWITKVITIPIADMVLRDGSNYTLTADSFWREIRRLEWERSQGLWAEQILAHNNTRIIAGTTYVPENQIINGYTITMDPLAERVYLTGDNNNIVDVLNINGVSVIPSNSAGNSTSSLTPEQATQLQQTYTDLTRLMKAYGMIPGAAYKMPPAAGGPVLEDGQPIADVSGDCDTGFTVTGRP